jgi:FHA domain
MAIKRGPDGIPVDEPTVLKPKDEPPTQATGAASSATNSATNSSTKGGQASPHININIDDDPTIPRNASAGNNATGEGSSSLGLFLDDPPTAPARGTSAAASTNPEPVVKPKQPAVDDAATQIVRAKPAAATAPIDAMADPLAGWLVVIEGPGKGHALTLGYGQNSVGRSDGERVTINFGDGLISRSNHMTVTYDPRGNQFYIQPGSGTNLTYLNEEPAPVLQPMVLTANSHITIGETTLRFIPFCSDDFNWDSIEEK